MIIEAIILTCILRQGSCQHFPPKVDWLNTITRRLERKHLTSPPKWINFYTALRNGASSSIGYLTEFHYQKDFIEFFSYFLVITFKENLQIWGLEPETNQLQ